MRLIVIRVRFGSLKLPAFDQEEGSTTMGGKDGGINFGNWDPYPKKDSDEREWDRSYYPPIELPPQIYQPSIPPPEWQVPCPSLQPRFRFEWLWRFTRTVVRVVAIVLSILLGNGLLWVVFRSVSLSLFPSAGLIVAWVPALACTGFSGLIFGYYFPNGELYVEDVESFFVLLSIGICVLLLALFLTADMFSIQGR